MRVLPLLACIALSACAAPSHWVNPQNPTADLEADIALCEKDAARVDRLNRIISQSVPNCLDPRACSQAEELQNIRIAAQVTAARKQCMAARGWQQRG